MLLDRINRPNDIRKFKHEELNPLAKEIREFLIQTVSENGGHLASNLGAVELTMALHLALHFPEDKLVWDVGHQSYTHKLLTGRKDRFDTLRKHGGLSGFPKTNESACDAFNTGHSSTSISAALGLATARDLKGENYRVACVIGDGALTGGMAFEALNNAALLKKNFIIVLNDNTMSISKNVGGLPAHLSNIRTTGAYKDLKEGIKASLNKIPLYGEKMVHNIQSTKSSLKQLLIPGMIFENLGLTYLGPYDGHDIMTMYRAFVEAENIEGPVVVHVVTQKGKGYIHAERHPARFHGTGAFCVESGLPKKKQTLANYTNVFSTVMVKMGERNQNVIAITAAMEDGVGLKRFHNRYPERFFDVGIAEGHAVTFAAGLAKEGFVPVVAVYSSFLQRAFDQIVHDVCMQSLHVVFAIDRAGLVGADGQTHQGVLDVSYMMSIPNMTVMAPKNKWELSDMLKFAIAFDGPISLRYPRGQAYSDLKQMRNPIEYGKSEMLQQGKNIAILALGNMVKIAVEVVEQLKNQGVLATLINARFAMPFDQDRIRELADEHTLLVTMEENVRSGGFGEHVGLFVKEENIELDVLTIALPDDYIEQGSVDELFEEVGLDATSVSKRILAQYEK
ncbi:1-deoxy-D-xylulose-5-phosphate synthase [Eubacterium oxidoreducens]|uniref:1-deoxy-D-xylulose-5-phosphate synthase n=1 Tax=Eubacterium oxidoreducens TaxID=1732 RepID=A0A1G6AJU9_EUBOX|nr:1-deoxy-D-xylulose-5-phosphate synthase [Eubacterium oxidoreducens]SDB08675.1 1-deoxy-D-xylulose-5-phosphate synthase [Eubacterium oxidoreducens]